MFMEGGARRERGCSFLSVLLWDSGRKQTGEAVLELNQSEAWSTLHYDETRLHLFSNFCPEPGLVCSRTGVGAGDDLPAVSTEPECSPQTWSQARSTSVHHPTVNMEKWSHHRGQEVSLLLLGPWNPRSPQHHQDQCHMLLYFSPEKSWFPSRTSSKSQWKHKTLCRMRPELRTNIAASHRETTTEPIQHAALTVADAGQDSWPADLTPINGGKSWRDWVLFGFSSFQW